MGIVIGLAVLCLVVAGLLAYWLVMITLFVIGLVFLFWAVLFMVVFGDPYVGALCSVFATAISMWLFSLRAEK
jgi:hypothetical protein